MDQDETTPRLRIEIELEFSGPTEATLSKWAADVLRKLATNIEKDERDTGHHAVKDGAGKPVGEIYLDHSADLD